MWFNVTYIVTRTATYMIEAPTRKFAEMEAYTHGVLIAGDTILDVEVLEMEEVVMSEKLVRA